MTFLEVLPALLEGAKVRRGKGRPIYFEESAGALIQEAHGWQTVQLASLYKGDFTSDDWEVVNDAS